MTKETERRRIISAALRKIQDAHGVVTPTAVVEAAKNPKHPLHGEFIWDNALAANLQRQDRARELIRNYLTVVVIHSNEKIVSPYYVRDPRREAGARS